MIERTGVEFILSADEFFLGLCGVDWPTAAGLLAFMVMTGKPVMGY
jgi:hypothetical protein